jgi:hypothetical protein
VPDDEAEMMAAWEAELDDARSEISADEDAGPTVSPSEQSETTVQPELDEEEAEAAMMAEWEARIVDDMAISAEQASTEEDSGQGLSESRAAEIAEQERAEQEAEAELAAAWLQADKTPAVTEPVAAVEVNEEPDQAEDIDTGPPVTLTDAKTALSEMWDDLTEEPLPSDEDLDAMFEEIRQLDKQDSGDDEPSAMTYKPTKRGDLQSILSSIPSFSDMNKKSDE